jgi:hypothetical protein
MSFLSRLRYLTDRAIYELRGRKEGAIEIRSRAVLQSFLADPGNPVFISFPRTGSHWIRMVMELYFERPSLILVFYYPENRDYMAYHNHDLELEIERENVLYLYRNPVPTIFSQLTYHLEDPEDESRIRHWTDLYGRHLDKWLFEESFSRRKTVLRYERFREDLAAEFEKICTHYGSVLDPARLAEADARTRKEDVIERTKLDRHVVSRKAGYEASRQSFVETRSGLVWECLLHGRERLREAFEPDEIPG